MMVVTLPGSPSKAAHVQELTVPQGTFNLQRWPSGGDQTLRAWDAGDELVLAHLDEAGLTGRTLVVNDSFGALAVALADRDVVSWGDSELSREGAARNLDRNGRSGDELTFVPAHVDPTGPFDVVIVKVPRTLSLLEDQLRRLRPALAPGATVVGAGMVKLIHNSTIELFDRIIGTTTTSLAKRKARMIHPVYDPALNPGEAPGPVMWEHDRLTVVNLAGVFSRESLDLGTRVLFEHLPPVNASHKVLDLGCGNGVVGAAVANRAGQVTFVDDSFLAIASARATMAANHPDVEARYLVRDATDGVDDASQDIVLCNPPFHAQGARVTDVAWRMVTGAHRVLRAGGSLTLVGNRQLEHHIKCKAVFGNAEVISGDAKFVVVRAVR